MMGTLLLSLTLVGALLGLVAGSAMQWLTLHLLGNLLPADLPPPSWRPFALGLAVAFFITLLLAFVPFLRLLKVPPLRVLRRELEAGSRPGWHCRWRCSGCLGWCGALPPMRP